MIEEYLREVRWRLPFALGARERVLAEARHHLEEAAASASEEEAVRRFGPPEAFAERLQEELRLRAAGRASWLVPLIALAFVGPFYVVPENAFPPAPWPVKPHYLAWKQEAALVSFLVALAFAAASLVLGRVRPRLARTPLAGCVGALAAAVAFASVTAVQWVGAVPGSPALLVYGGMIPALVTMFVAALLVALEARPRRAN